MKIASSVTFDNECKILKTESRIMANLFLGFLFLASIFRVFKKSFIIPFNDNALEEELIKCNMCGLMNLKNG